MGVVAPEGGSCNCNRVVVQTAAAVTELVGMKVAAEEVVVIADVAWIVAVVLELVVVVVFVGELTVVDVVLEVVLVEVVVWVELADEDVVELVKLVVSVLMVVDVVCVPTIRVIGRAVSSWIMLPLASFKSTVSREMP